MNLLLIAWAIGFGVLLSMPTGPLATLILKNTLAEGLRAGLVTISSLLLAEFVYVALFMLGFGATILKTPWLRSSLFLAGAVTLVFVGVKSLYQTKKPVGSESKMDHAGLGAMFRTGFLITLLNPAILTIFAGFLASARAGFGADVVQKNLLASLVSMEAGTALWFGGVVLLLSRLPAPIAARIRRSSDLVAGVVLICFGLWLFFDTVRHRSN